MACTSAGGRAATQKKKEQRHTRTHTYGSINTTKNQQRRTIDGTRSGHTRVQVLFFFPRISSPPSSSPWRSLLDVDGQRLAVPLLEALEHGVHELALADADEHLVALLAGGLEPLAGQEHAAELLAHEAVQRERPAVRDPVRHGGGALGDRHAGGLHLLGQHRAELLLEPGDLGEHGGLPLRVAAAEGVVHQHGAQLLHQRQAAAGRVLRVREHGLAVDGADQLLLAEAGAGELARGVHGQHLLGHLGHGVLHRRLDVLLEVAQVHGLAQRHDVGGRHELQDVDRLGGLPGRDEAQGVHVLVVLLRALHVVGDGVAQVLELGAVGGHGDLGALEAVVQAGVAAAGQVGGEPVVVELVDELGELREHELADVGDGEAGVVHGHADGGALEVAAVQRLAAVDVDDRVVVHGVDLALDGLGGGADDLDLGAQPLRRRAERVPVLLGLQQRVQLVQLLGLLHEGAAIQDVLHDGRGLDGPRVVLQLVGQVVRVLGLAVHDLAEDGGQDLRQDGQDVGVVHHGGRERGAHGRAVDDGEALLGVELEEAALDAGDLERLGGVHLPPVDGDGLRVGAARDEAGDVGERDQVARRGDGAPERQAGADTGVEQLRDGLEDLEADAGVALEEGVDAHQHRRAGDLRRQRVPVAAGAEDSGVEMPAEKGSQRTRPGQSDSTDRWRQISVLN
uniref:Uncharacterized protein n=1 Tax=Zea mays TaxID=4577 RepID=A0A804U8N8_MAIZE